MPLGFYEAVSENRLCCLQRHTIHHLLRQCAGNAGQLADAYFAYMLFGLRIFTFDTFMYPRNVSARSMLFCVRFTLLAGVHFTSCMQHGKFCFDCIGWEKSRITINALNTVSPPSFRNYWDTYVWYDIEVKRRMLHTHKYFICTTFQVRSMSRSCRSIGQNCVRDLTSGKNNWCAR